MRFTNVVIPLCVMVFLTVFFYFMFASGLLGRQLERAKTIIQDFEKSQTNVALINRLVANSKLITDYKSELHGLASKFSELHDSFELDARGVYKKEVEIFDRMKNLIHRQQHLWEERRELISELKQGNITENFLITNDLNFITQDVEGEKRILRLVVSQMRSDRSMLKLMKLEEELVDEVGDIDLLAMSYEELFTSIPINWMKSSLSDQPSIHSNVMPAPQKYNVTSDTYLTVYSSKHKKCFLQLSCNKESRIVKSAFERLKQRLPKHTNVLNTIDDSKQLHSKVINPGNKVELVVDFQEEISVPKLRDEENYVLRVSAEEGKIVVTAKTSTGVVRAFSTLRQLLQVCFEKKDERCKEYIYIRSCLIEDYPRFLWRGIMVDTARHFQPLENMLRMLDGMELAKLNVLHWHLSDDQGYRLESKVHPLLHEKGSRGKYFTQEEARQVIEYARLRGIRVVPEIDMPVRLKKVYAFDFR